MTSERRLSTSRAGRLSLLGRLAGGVAAGMVGEAGRQLAQGRRPSMSDLLMTPANAQRLADRLSEMRGAAMKVGQLLSMDGGQLLPAQLSQVLEGLRENAHPMPLGQVAEVLEGAWGSGWEKRFQRFFFQPAASASIGQVHEAWLKDGRRVAVKIQYPGVRRCIDSDVDNVASLLRLTRLVPEEIDLSDLLDEARQQLHLEADYRREADCLTQFSALVGDDPRFRVPQLIDELSTPDVLVMEFLDGQAIDRLHDAPAAQRNAAAGALFELALREVFEWGLVQTDPNFANYLHDPHSGQIQLLDFGATRAYTPSRREGLRRLLWAAVDGHDSDVCATAIEVGYLGQDDPPIYREGIVGLLRLVTEPVRQTTPYAFADRSLAQRMSDQVMDLRMQQKYARLPPHEILWLHRKLAGLYLLLARLQARLPVRALLEAQLPDPAGDIRSTAGDPLSHGL